MNNYMGHTRSRSTLLLFEALRHARTVRAWPARALAMYNREPRDRGVLGQATPWSCGPSSLDTFIEPIKSDATLTLIASTAKDKVQGRHTVAAAKQQTVFKGRVSGSGKAANLNGPPTRYSIGRAGRPEECQEHAGTHLENRRRTLPPIATPANKVQPEPARVCKRF